MADIVADGLQSAAATSLLLQFQVGVRLCARNQQCRCAIRMSHDYIGFMCVCKYAETRFHSSKCRFLCVFLNERHMAIPYAKRNSLVRVCFFSAVGFPRLHFFIQFSVHNCTCHQHHHRLHTEANACIQREYLVHWWCAAFTPFKSGRRSHRIRLCSPFAHISDIRHISNEMKFWVNCR